MELQACVRRFLIEHGTLIGLKARIKKTDSTSIIKRLCSVRPPAKDQHALLANYTW